MDAEDAGIRGRDLLFLFQKKSKQKETFRIKL